MTELSFVQRVSFFLFAPTLKLCLNPLVYTELTIISYGYKFNICIPSNCKYNNSSYHWLIPRMQYICSHMTAKLLTLKLKHIINVFINSTRISLLTVTLALIKDEGIDHSWFLMNGKPRKKTQKHCHV